MGRLAESLVWERTRVSKGDLAMLVKIADLADDEGRNAWPEVKGLMKYCRASERATQYTLARLERMGEIEIEYNEGGREITLRGGRTFRPKWFIHVRCVCAWEEYEREGKESATFADSASGLRRGRPRRKSARVADFESKEIRNNLHINPQKHVDQSATSGSAYKEGSVSDPLVEQKQGLAPRYPPENQEPEDPEKNLSVLTKLAHEVFDLLSTKADIGEVTDALKWRCSKLAISHYPGDVLRRAIDSALWQRTHRQEAR